MSIQNKVIWSEGMFLRQQHFQQQERYIDSRFCSFSNQINPYFWGVHHLQIDNKQLELGNIAINQCTGIFPDGTPFDAPNTDQLPNAIEIPENTYDTVIYLALPLSRQNSIEAATDKNSNPMARYSIEETQLFDSTNGNSSTAGVHIGKLTPQLLLEKEDRSQFTHIPIAKITEISSDGKINLAENFIPPCLDCHCNENLHGYIQELKGLLQQRANHLATHVIAPRQNSVGTINDFLLLQVVNRFEALFHHLAAKQILHPESLYQDCLQLMGELATFTTPEKRLARPEPYQHRELEKTFLPLMATLRQFLSTVLQKTAVSIDLQDNKFGIRLANINDKDLLDNASFILAAKADMEAEQLRNRLPSQLKIGPIEQIKQLVNLHLPGINFQALPVAPPQVPYHAGFTYFELDRSSTYWEQLNTSGGFAIHVGGDFPGLELEFWSIRE